MQTRGKSKKVIIAGGGYAGLATLISLRQHCPDSDILLIDPSHHHIRRTHLHESVRHQPGAFRVSFADIGKRFGFRHVPAALEFGPETLKRWQRSGTIDVGESSYEFDYLVIATGTKPIKPASLEGAHALDDIIRTDIRGLLRGVSEQANQSDRTITVVGSGATGIQFLFELNEAANEWRRTAGLSFRLRLVNAEANVLNQFPASFNRYVIKRMKHAGIEHVKNAFLVGLSGDEILLRNHENNEEFNLPSSLTLMFLGQKANPEKIIANAFGQVTIDGEVMDNIFTAGDCSVFSGYGANTMSAQVAVRKGKKVARNIQLHAGPFRSLERYNYQELGYFVSLGPLDGVGWLGVKSNVLAALPAFAIKEAVGTQFDLLLAGLDTYLV